MMQYITDAVVDIHPIHSKDDEAVPFEHAERISQTCPEATFWKIEDYRHVGANAHPDTERGS
jgi:hypothetical protein